MDIRHIAYKLLNSVEPSIRYKVLVNVFDEDPSSKKVKDLQEEIRNSVRVKKLLANRDRSGRLACKRNIYDKWQGAHWILASLADIGYPPQDESLFAVRDEVLDFWLDDLYFKEYIAKTKADVYSKKYVGVPKINGRYRRCASQQGYALFYLLKLGLANERIHQLAERLLHWQWPDGGWNCDKNPTASTSTFIHTLWALRGLGLYFKIYPDENVNKSIRNASEVFLKRKLFRRLSTGEIIRDEFIALHYPLYWHYDILGALKVMAEVGLIKDDRCNEALDLLMQKVIAGEGWPAEKSYYKISDKILPDHDYVDWGGTSRKYMNEWVTADALYVMKESGRAVCTDG